MAYTLVGPFADNAAPYLTAANLNHLEAGIVTGNAAPAATAFGPADLNTYFTQSGAYRGSSLTNAPGGSSASFMIAVNYQNSSTQTQFAYQMSNNTAWFRTMNGGTWSTWAQVQTVNDTGWITSSTGITAASGWTLNSAKYRILNGVAYLSAQATKSGSTITAGASGNFANSLVFNLPSILVPTVSNGNYANSGGNATFLASGFASLGSSGIVLGVASPSYTIAVGDVADLMGSHVL